ncbi:MAG TPA: hypothetical protein VFL78_01895 [Rhodanobacteraceae bacterium]|nr:hypothetical protein [Rhodanobacteraceae bacterium]
MSASMPLAAGRRQHILRALGVTPYALRGRREVDALPVPEGDGAGPVSCVLVMPEGCTERLQRLVMRIMQALGDGFAGAPRVVVKAGDLDAPAPAASAYLAFGETQARALGRSLPTAVMAAAEVLLLDEPQALLEAGGKRRLWQAVSGLRRHWRETAETE